MASKFDKSELVRVPGGILFIAIALAGGRASLGALSEGGIGIVSGLIGLFVAVVFLGIGGVMALGWIGAGRKRR